MKHKLPSILMVAMFISVASCAAEDQTPLDGQAVPQSLGGQAGEAARELKETAGESLSTGAMKVAETSKKVETEVQDTLKILQQQWEAFAKQVQEKTQQVQKQLQQQWQDFNKSLK